MLTRRHMRPSSANIFDEDMKMLSTQPDEEDDDDMLDLGKYAAHAPAASASPPSSSMVSSPEINLEEFVASAGLLGVDMLDGLPDLSELPAIEMALLADFSLPPSPRALSISSASSPLAYSSAASVSSPYHPTASAPPPYTCAADPDMPLSPLSPVDVKPVIAGLAKPVRHWHASGPMPSIQGVPRVIWAVCLRNVSAIQDFAVQGDDINVANSRGQTALHLACIGNGCVPVISALVAANANVNAVDVEQSTPLMYACRLARDDIVSVLLRARCDVSRTDQRGMTAVMHACSQACTNIVRSLQYTDQSTINMRDASGWSALHWAVAVRAHDCVRALLEFKDILTTSLSIHEETPLHIAARNGDTETARLLLSSLAPSRAQHVLSIRSSRGLTPRQCADAAGQAECAAMLEAAEGALEDQFRQQARGLDAGQSASPDSAESLDIKPPRKRPASLAIEKDDATLSAHRARRREYMRDHRQQGKQASLDLEAKVGDLEKENSRLSAEVTAMRMQAQYMRDLVAARAGHA
eukprot:m.47271 g.47271  ORF g.47271 m.47271 type:complete len:526 (-) comp5964_c0_seq1:335-1912(-)